MSISRTPTVRLEASVYLWQHLRHRRPVLGLCPTSTRPYLEIRVVHRIDPCSGPDVPVVGTRAPSQYRISRPKETRPTQEHVHRGAKACMLDAPLLHASLLSALTLFNLGRCDRQSWGTSHRSPVAHRMKCLTLNSPHPVDSPSPPKRTHLQRSSSSRAPLLPPPVRPPNQTQSKHRAPETVPQKMGH